ncbi:hypothetical protein MNBD_GAMMA26-834 [hydrothermal vent metagenome]|uniref:RRM domain-containing protein n=1 Tax=hydrothermal vent metagenome TaxID=652676 RepID=A0A3B1BST3_9ZZZZ
MGLFIGNLETGTTTSDLLGLFNDHDGITDIELVKRRSEDGEVRFGHVLFRSQSAMEKAVNHQKTMDLYGSVVQIREYVERAEKCERRIFDGQSAERSETERRKQVERRFQL